MLSVRKGTTKRCCYGVCKSDTRYNSFKGNTYYFINFPKPCLEYRKKIIKSSSKLHIKACAKCAKCELWVKKCGRSDRGFRSIDDVTKDTYICSLHFHGESGPTEKNPDPLSYQEFQQIDKSIDKVVKVRTSLFEKYKRAAMEGENESEKTKINNISTVAQKSTAHEEIFNVPDDTACFIQQILPDQSAEMRILEEETNCEGTNKFTTIEIQTDSIKMRNKSVQVKLQKNSAVEKFVNAIRIDEKKCIFYTSLNFEQILALHRFLSPACDNLEYWGNRETKNKSCENSNKYKLTSMQQLILVLLRLRMGYLIEDLAYKFDVSTGFVSKICTTWIYFLHNEFTTQLKPFMFPSRKTIAETLPKIFRSIKNIRVIVDCAEFFCQSPTNFEHQGNLYSSYKAHTTFKVLIGCTPNGCISFVSDVFEGSISDPEIFKRSKIADLLQPGDVVLADRGFTVHDIVEAKQAHLNIPPFLNGRDRLTPQEEMLTKKIAKQRIYVEHVIGRIKKFRLLQTVLPLNMRTLMSQIIFVCACLVNFQTPLVFDEQE
ncbi:uncharacterized protein LOC124293084 isoform X1 [Neodiprion lecontei]|uniref:Uncharacterized protein LOC124293084 isoform X1 n=1 Tax=Neodiprion lecontei TaxID=441921 RepID=A0ABM3FJX8_NEOLC|nr:uncharacterized protein LOC124293084 isoform X1 [Neodiprion lecontei]